MNKTISVIAISLFLILHLSGCARTPYVPPDELNKISSISNTTGCEFIKAVYFETRAANLIYYAQLNTHKFGGDSYKLLDTCSEKALHTNIMMVNMEVYKCKK